LLGCRKFNRLSELEGVPEYTTNLERILSIGQLYPYTKRRSMSLPTINQIVEGPNPLGFSGTGPYEPSIASSASSSQASIFSEAASAQSSVASSISDDFRSSQEDVRDHYCAPAQQPQNYSKVAAHLSQASQQQLSYADVTSVPSQQRQHPRRCSSAKYQRPPPLVRQADRKVNFVDNLVGKQQSP
jgi:hypothetical protein